MVRGKVENLGHMNFFLERIPSKMASKANCIIYNIFLVHWVNDGESGLKSHQSYGILGEMPSWISIIPTELISLPIYSLCLKLIGPLSFTGSLK